MNNSRQHRSWIHGVCRRTACAALALAIMLVPALLATASAQAQIYSYNVLHKFTGVPDGTNPFGGLVLDAQGNLYGTTWFGGDPACSCGVVFKVDTSGKETILYSFTGIRADGRPWGNLAMDAQGNLYGATYSSWTIFEVDTNGNETVLYTFTGGADGGRPTGGLVLDDQGNLYGTTWYGGNLNCQEGGQGIPGCGTVFALDPAGNLTVLYTFCSQENCADGALPNGGLVSDAQGNLYGTTQVGGAYRGGFRTPCDLGCGTVFKVDPSGHETVLHSFNFNPSKGILDGAYPSGGLVMDGQGNLYGTTRGGGAGPKGKRAGTIFKVDASGNESLLYSFGGSKPAPSSPVGALIIDAAGNFYGTTDLGGADDLGTVFMLDTSLNLAVLYSFASKNGFDPYSGLVMDASGNLYGTTFAGGIQSDSYCDVSCGVVFDLLTASAATTTTLTSSPNPSTHGQPVTFTAVVQSAAGTPADGETVSFMKRKAVIGTGTLSGGSASFTTSKLGVGTVPIMALYPGDPTHSPSTSNVVEQVVEKAAK
ncbi:MAG: choice-of-anchor tandem repeat GloVer-containing protein [Terriglobales bacterium]